MIEPLACPLKGTELALATPEMVTKVKLVQASADLNLPATPLDPIYDDKTNKPRVTGPIEFAIDGKDDTAWGIDAGPGRRNQPRRSRRHDGE